MSDKLAVMYVSGGVWKDTFGRSLLQFALWDKHQRNLLDGIAFANGLYVDQNRNNAVRMFLQSDCEWALSLDTDIGFEPDVPYRLLEQAHPELRPIVSALYCGRIATFAENGAALPPRIVPMFFNRRPNGMYHTVEALKTVTQEIDGIGMGCALIHRRVFESFPNQDGARPWFACEDRRPEGFGAQLIGEDLIFCERAKAAGFRIFGDSRIQVSHEKSDMLTVEHMILEQRRLAA